MFPYFIIPYVRAFLEPAEVGRLSQVCTSIPALTLTEKFDLLYQSKLEIASKRGDIEVVHFILEKHTVAQANVDASIKVAVLERNLKLLELLLTVRDVRHIGFDARVSTISVAILRKDLEIVKLLIEYRIDVNDHGFDLLHGTISVQCTSIVKLLLDCGACRNFPEKLVYAVMVGNHDVVKLLLDYGGPGIQNKEALLEAAHRARIPVLRLLLDHGLRFEEDRPTDFSEEVRKVLDEYHRP